MRAFEYGQEAEDAAGRAEAAAESAAAAQAEAEAQAAAAATSAATLANPFAECTTWADVKAILPIISSLRTLYLTLPKFGETQTTSISCPDMDLFLTLPGDLMYRWALKDCTFKNVVVYVPNRKRNLVEVAKHNRFILSGAVIAPYATDVAQALRAGNSVSAQEGLKLSVYAPRATNCTAVFWEHCKAGKMTLYAPKCTNIDMLCRPMQYNVYAQNPSIDFTLGDVTTAKQAFSACKKIPDGQFPTNWQYLKYGSGMFELCELGKAVAIAILDSLQTATEETGTNIWCITVGIHVDHKTDEEVLAAIEAAEARGWTVAVQWNGTATAAAASTYGMRRAGIYARRCEAEEEGEQASLEWAHYVTNWEAHGYVEFGSVEEAAEFFGVELEPVAPEEE
jgi:hypothetical protein